MMKLIDLTHIIEEGMPVYPGTEPPKLTPANTLEKDGFRETLLSMYSHTGTHMDAPAHIFADRPTLDQLQLSRFIGRGLVLDCTEVKEGQRITMELLKRQMEAVEWAEFILFRTGWSKYWGTERYYGKFPVPDEAVVRFLVDSQKKGVGIDAISVDPITEEALPNHQKILGSNMVIVENLTNLELIGEGLFTFAALPLKWKDADGSPVRALAMPEK